MGERGAKTAVAAAAGARRRTRCVSPGEPHVGSKADGLKTTAVRVEREQGSDYLLNGGKQFFTSGKNSDGSIVMAVADKAAGKRGISAFTVPTNTPGYTVARIDYKMGQHASDTAQVLLENFRVPAANLLGDEDPGAEDRLVGHGRRGHRHRLAKYRHCARGVRGGAALLERPRRFQQAHLRASGGAVSIGQLGRAIKAARQLTYRAASLKDAGRPCLKGAAMAKLYASEMAEAVCSTAIQIHGGCGHANDFPVERIYRDMRVCQVYEGTSDVQKVLSGRGSGH